jgi:hypothetical protein
MPTIPKTSMNGRPRADGKPAGHFKTTKLYKMLRKSLPDFCKDGELYVPVLAKTLGYTNYHVYRTLGANEVSRDMFSRLLKCCPTLNKKDLLPFAPEDVRALLND